MRSRHVEEHGVVRPNQARIARERRRRRVLEHFEGVNPVQGEIMARQQQQRYSTQEQCLRLRGSA
jgi:hypothetical protein